MAAWSAGGPDTIGSFGTTLDGPIDCGDAFNSPANVCAIVMRKRLLTTARASIWNSSGVPVLLLNDTVSAVVPFWALTAIRVLPWNTDRSTSPMLGVAVKLNDCPGLSVM